MLKLLSSDFVTQLYNLFITDNHAVHHVPEGTELIYNSGVIICYLPPYSPDFNYIEEAFDQVKHDLRQNNVILQTAADPVPLIWNAFLQITADNCWGYKHYNRYI